jgi:TPR repeat protein
MTVSMSKLIILAVMGFVAVVLGTGVLTMQLRVRFAQDKARLMKGTSTTSKVGMTNNRRGGGSNSHGANGANGANTDDDDVDGDESSSSSPQDSTDSDNFLYLQYLQRQATRTGSSYQESAKAFWKMAQAFLDWDIVSDSDSDDHHHHGLKLTAQDFYNGTAASYMETSPTLYLQQAANAGHPTAQLYLANAYASGIWPFRDYSIGSGSGSGSRTTPNLTVPDELILHPHTPQERQQLTDSYLLWHMAAIAGNPEAAMALAYRIEAESEDLVVDTNPNTNTADAKTTPQQQICQDTLAYYQAAADAIVDELEHSIHSRAKVTPNIDKHFLAQLYMHGSSSQLAWNNKPDESSDALQFYHLKATTWGASIDIHAAYTLGHLYQHGIRGVPQNLTLSLQYYEIAGAAGHWESAGQAGLFYLWGMGTANGQPDLLKAWELFPIGAPDLDNCRRRHDQSIRLLQNHADKPRSEDEDDSLEVVTCDTYSLNGMGLLYLHGIEQKEKTVLKRDLGMAEKYFTLAKEMGNADACYNLAMLWLGWKTHYKTMDDLQVGGTSLSADPHLHLEKAPLNFALHLSRHDDRDVFKGPGTKDITEAFKLLQLAANKGHLQAKHRVGVLFTQGIPLQAGNTGVPYHALAPDCLKAKSQFHWIIENAWPQRAQRLRKGYEDYMSGHVDSSLRNYLFAAETGSLVGQANAAWLLERGVCLDLSPLDCAKASVRLWKAAAAMGHAEACLRVGDFYYYGRLRDSASSGSSSSSSHHNLPVGPFGWVQYLLYPEIHLLPLGTKWGQRFQEWWSGNSSASTQHQMEPQGEKDCEDDPSSCLSPAQKHQQLVDSDLNMAAHYYQIAVEKHHSARANFNLGFLHEWGLGLKQDFPLAKRHYDLAGGTQEAELAVQIALWSMSVHEQLVKLQVLWNDYYSPSTNDDKSPQPKEANDDTGYASAPRRTNPKDGQPVPGYKSDQKTKTEVILDHLFSWSSLLIVILTFVLSKLMEFRQTQQRI